MPYGRLEGTWEAGIGNNQESDGLSALPPSSSEAKPVHGGTLTL